MAKNDVTDCGSARNMINVTAMEAINSSLFLFIAGSDTHTHT